MSQLSRHISAIARVFNEKMAGGAAHAACEPYLRALAGDREVLFRVIEGNMADRRFFEIRSPSLDVHLPILVGPGWSLTMNFFTPTAIPGSEDVAYTSIHHHERTLLTTACAVGVYPTIVFDQVSATDPAQQLRIQAEFDHAAGNVAHIPVFTPHVVFYPKELTVTVALWSGSAERHSMTPTASQRNQALGLWAEKRTSDLRLVDDHMYYIADNRFWFSQFSALPACGGHFAENFFWKLQQLGYQNMRFIRQVVERLSNDQKRRLAPVLRRFLAGEPLQIEESSYCRRNFKSHPTRAQILEVCGVSRSHRETPVRTWSNVVP